MIDIQVSPPRANTRGGLRIPATILALHALGWGALFGVILPAQQSAGGDGTALLALSLGAYALGIRHAFDADHIAAIDNATRQLIARGRRSASVGFWFALGHSSVVALAVLLIAAGASAFTAVVADDNSSLRHIAGIWGGTVSGVFLLATGILNLPALKSLTAARRNLRPGQTHQPEDVARALNGRGVMSRLLSPVTKLVDRPSRMYPVGVLFGLGLDTVASISLFALAGTFSQALPWYAVLVLPILFTAGMTLFDTLDGALVSRVYRWASSDAKRTLNHNIATTSVSVALAFVVGTSGLIAVVGEIVGADFALTSILESVDFNILGIAAVAFFAVAWLATASRRGQRAVS